jgi:hypothetical protein
MEYPNQIVEHLLQRFKPVLGGDFEKYRNHVYRVFSNCLLMDSEPLNREKYAIAAVFHDIGIWTDGTFDYLAPSIGQVELYLNEIGKGDWTSEISQMIYWHHKLSQYKGERRNTVETFRKADWVDVSLGFLTFGFDKQKIRRIRRKYPNAGFHVFLLKQSVKNFINHPLNPLPVFKK